MNSNAGAHSGSQRSYVWVLEPSHKRYLQTPSRHIVHTQNDFQTGQTTSQIFLNTLKERGPHPHSRSDTEQADGNRTAARQNTAKQARERESYPEDNAIISRDWHAASQAGGSCRSGVRAHEYIMTEDGSPWRSYERIYELRLGVSDRVTVAERKSPPFNIVTATSLSGPRVEDKLHMLQQIQHTNFVSAFDAFKSEQSLAIESTHSSAIKPTHNSAVEVTHNSAIEATFNVIVKATDNSTVKAVEAIETILSVVVKATNNSAIRATNSGAIKATHNVIINSQIAAPLTPSKLHRTLPSKLYTVLSSKPQTAVLSELSKLHTAVLVEE